VRGRLSVLLRCRCCAASMARPLTSGAAASSCTSCCAAGRPSTVRALDLLHHAGCAHTHMQRPHASSRDNAHACLAGSNAQQIFRAVLHDSLDLASPPWNTVSPQVSSAACVSAHQCTGRAPHASTQAVAHCLCAPAGQGLCAAHAGAGPQQAP
jgi:hypothetical protein